MNVVCPNQVTINNWMTDAGISSPTLMENMWLVDKQGYDKCIVNEEGDPKTNKQILMCDNPRKIKFKPFVFHPRFNMDEPRFAPGHHYYFICKLYLNRKIHDNLSLAFKSINSVFLSSYESRFEG